MKLILAIVNNDDGNTVMRKLNQAGFSVTRMASTGGFLRAGNTTLMIGTEADAVDNAIAIISENCMKRTQIVFAPRPFFGGNADYSSYPEEVETGGATIFVVDVERFEKV